MQYPTLRIQNRTIVTVIDLHSVRTWKSTLNYFLFHSMIHNTEMIWIVQFCSFILLQDALLLLIFKFYDVSQNIGYSSESTSLDVYFSFDMS